jgi:hypothetical protein
MACSVVYIHKFDLFGGDNIAGQSEMVLKIMLTPFKMKKRARSHGMAVVDTDIRKILQAER